MAVSTCRVSFTDLDGITHAVKVDAESLYEAVVLAVAEFRAGEIMTDMPGATTEFTVLVLRKPIEHKLMFKAVERWVQPSTRGGPAEMVRRERLRKMLAI